MANYVGTAGNDNYVGTAAADDFDLSQGGSDRVFGGGGDDTFDMGAEFDKHDRLNGGDGYDFVKLAGNYHLTFLPTTIVDVDSFTLNSSYNYNFTTDDANVAATERLFFDMGSSGTGSLRLDGSAETDGYFYVQAVGGNDRLLGGAGDDILDADTGQNVLKGEGGNDSLSGAGLDTFDGGDGDDSAYLDRTAATVNLSFNLTDVSQVTTLVGDGSTVQNVENVSIFAGTGGDTLSTGAGHDNLYGGGGDDTLQGRGGDDSLDGGSGTNSLFGGAGDDYLSSSGIDALNGGDGYDIARIDRTGSATALTFNFTDSSTPTDLGDGTTVIHCEEFQLVGGDGSDTFVTGAGNDRLEGGAGANVLMAGRGNDNITSTSNDTINAGGGDDYIEYLCRDVHDRRRLGLRQFVHRSRHLDGKPDVRLRGPFRCQHAGGRRHHRHRRGRNRHHQWKRQRHLFGMGQSRPIPGGQRQRHPDGPARR